MGDDLGDMRVTSESMSDRVMDSTPGDFDARSAYLLGLPIQIGSPMNNYPPVDLVTG